MGLVLSSPLNRKWPGLPRQPLSADRPDTFRPLGPGEKLLSLMAEPHRHLSDMPCRFRAERDLAHQKIGSTSRLHHPVCSRAFPSKTAKRPARKTWRENGSVPSLLETCPASRIMLRHYYLPPIAAQPECFRPLDVYKGALSSRSLLTRGRLDIMAEFTVLLYR